MKNRFSRNIAVGAIGVAALLFVQLAVGDEAASGGAGHPAANQAPVLETLLSAELEGVTGTEVIVSRVVIPPNTSLPRHWHPAEEFAYVLEGAAILRRDGQDDVLIRAGEVSKIPLKQVHTAVTTEEGATILVFRVHEHGQPERTLVD